MSSQKPICGSAMVLLLVTSLLTPMANADWRDDVGYTRLLSLAAADLPAASSSGYSQIEAPESSTNYIPETTNPNFSSKTFTLKSGTSNPSSHATNVAHQYYGTNSSLQTGPAPVDLYEVNSWIGSTFLKAATNAAPVIETRIVQNHSWVGSSSLAADATRRLDYAIDRDGFICAVGENNGNSTLLPDLLGQGYHTISVGLVNGGHSAGFTTLDGTGRIKPDIVAPESYTSFATPMVAAAGALLHTKLTANYTVSVQDRPRVVKALLLASATQNTVSSWSNTSSRPLDLRFGAGELNVNHAYNDLRAGKLTASPNTLLPPRGWAAESVAGNASKIYYFTIPAASAPTPFNAALTWHRSMALASGNRPNATATITATLANLNLRLYQTNNFILGTQLADSSSSVDNVEFIHQNTLPPGNYALVVENFASSATTNFALAWHTLPSVSPIANVATASEQNLQPGSVTITRTGDTNLALFVPLTIGGTAIPGSHYQTLPASVTLPAGQSSVAIPIIPIADNLAQGNRTVSVSVSDDFALVRDPSQIATVIIQDKPFDSWRFSHFSPTELADPAISAASADADGDQLVNLMEYALGLDPRQAGPLPNMLASSGGYLALSTLKNTDATDILWSAEVTDNLVDWNTAVILSNTGTNFKARDTILSTQASRRLIRLRISRP